MPLLAHIKSLLRQLLLVRLRWPGAYRAVVTLENRLFGRKLRLELCSACQLACPSCSTARGETRTGAVGWGTLRAADFQRFVARSGRIRSIEISNWGEIFLNKDLPKILQIAAEHRIALEAMNGVNLNHASEEMLEAVVRHRLRRMSVSIDGATPETYAIYRQQGDLTAVLRHIDRINHHKAAMGSPYPELTWQFVVFGHNEHEIALARQMARDRGMRFQPVRNLDFALSPPRDHDLVLRETGIDTRSDGPAQVAAMARRLDFCHQLWDAPQVNWDGRLLGCCFNNFSDFGNVFDVGLDAALASDAYRQTQAMLVGRAEPSGQTPCLQCPIYKGNEQEPRQGKVIPIMPAA
jgi:MoaA/NifB/PqqE/SkfB family radical SAM enzyme